MVVVVAGSKLPTTMGTALLLLVLLLAAASCHVSASSSQEEEGQENKNKRSLTSHCPDSTDTYDVVVVGAGMAGLTAAKTLLDAGIDNIAVLETREDVGGRMRSADLSDIFDTSSSPGWDGNLEIGAQWIHSGIGQSGKHPILALADEYKIEHYRQDLFDLDTYDTTTTEPPPLTPLKHNDLKKKIRDSNQAKKCVDDAAEELYEDSYAGGTLADRSVQSVRDEECEYAPSDAVERELDWQLYDLLYLLRPANMSLYNLPEDTYDDFKFPENFVTGRVQSIPEQYAIRNNLNDYIYHNVTVTHIDYNTPGVDIETTPCGMIEALKVIYTPSVGVLEKMAQDSAFDPAIDMSLNPMVMGTWVKVYVQFNEVFWDPNHQWITIGRTPEDLGFCTLWLNMDFEPSNPNRYLHPGSKLLLCIMDQGAVDRVLGENTVIDVNNNAHLQAILQPLEDTFGGTILDKVNRAYATNWLDDPCTYGSWENWEFKEDPFTLQDYYDFFAPRNGNFFLSGSASCNRFFAFMHGAFYSGIRAANWAIACLEDDDKCDEIPCSPCDDENQLQNLDFAGGCADNSP